MKLYKITLPPQMQSEPGAKNIKYVAAGSLAAAIKENASALHIELITDDLKLL
jgi:hypothetical protein